MEDTKPISKADFARELGVSDARISQYIRLGMPVRLDGRLDLQTVRAWVTTNIDPGRRADARARRILRRALATPPRAAGNSDEGARMNVLIAIVTRAEAVFARSCLVARWSVGDAFSATVIGQLALWQLAEDIAREQGLLGPSEELELPEFAPLDWKAIASERGC